MIVINSDNAIDVKEPVGSGNPTLTIEHGDGLVDFEEIMMGEISLILLNLIATTLLKKNLQVPMHQNQRLQGNLTGKNSDGF